MTNPQVDIKQSYIEQLAQEILVKLQGYDRPARRRWMRERLRIARLALTAQQDAKLNPGDFDKVSYAGAMWALDAACTRALELLAGEQDETTVHPSD